MAAPACPAGARNRSVFCDGAAAPESDRGGILFFVAGPVVSVDDEAIPFGASGFDLDRSDRSDDERVFVFALHSHRDRLVQGCVITRLRIFCDPVE